MHALLRYIVSATSGLLRICTQHIVQSYKFRQASDFWYLTGFEEPDSAIILEKNSSSRGYRMVVFSQGKDSHREKWDGARTSPDDLLLHFRADDAYSITSFPTILKTFLGDCSNVYADLPPSASLSRRGRSSTYQNLLKVCPTLLRALVLQVP